MIIKVGMADLKVAKSPSSLKTLGLGSCVGVCLFDPSTQTGGLVHIMLPRMADYRDKSNRAKYADTGIAAMLQEFTNMRARTSQLFAKIAGGAQMFSFASSSSVMRIGDRNVEAVKETLLQYKIPIISEDTGGNHGRTIEFSCEDGSLHIKTIGKGSKVI